MRKKFIFIIITIIMLMTLFAGTASAADELIENGDFEDNDLTYPEGFIPLAWINEHGVTEYGITDGLSGYGVFINNAEANDARLLQKISVQANTVYKISCDIYQTGITSDWGANISVEDTFIYAGGSEVVDGEWTRVDLYIETYDNQRKLEIAIRVGGYGSDTIGYAIFDNLSVTELDRADVPMDHEVFISRLNSDIDDVIEEEDTTTSKDDGMIFFSESLLISLLVLFVLFILYKKNMFVEKGNGPKDNMLLAILIGGFLIAFLIKIIIASRVYGYENDMACWQGWTNNTITYNLFGFYQEGVWCDYPPGYLYVLRIVGFIKQIFGINDGTVIYQVLVKTPAIVADMLTGIIIYKLAYNMKLRYTGVVLALLYVLMPAIVVNSAAWGQIDSVLTLFVIGYIYFLSKEKFLFASLMFVAGLLIKPQMLLFGPIVMVVFINFWRKHGAKKSLIQLAYGLGAGIAMFLILVVPFNNGQEFSWIFEKYFGTLSQYPYATLSACNFYAIFGGIWAKNTEKLFGVTYLVWSYIGTIGVILYYIFVSMKDKGNKYIYFNAGMLIIGLFMLGPKMHERYMYPALALLLISWLYNRDRRIFFIFSFFSITHFINVALTLANQHLPGDDLFIKTLSLASFIGFILMCILAYKLVDGDSIKPMIMPTKKIVKKSKSKKKEKLQLQDDEVTIRKVMKKKDWIIVGVVTLLYSALAFTNLGSMDVPETMWEVQESDQSFVVNLVEEQEVDRFMMYKGLSTSRANILIEYYDSSTNSWQEYVNIDFADAYSGESGSLYRWFNYNNLITTDKFRVTMVKPLLRVLEIGFVDANDNIIQIQGLSDINAVSEDLPYLLIDEQDTVEPYHTYMTGFYFDEIYHARTAWEMINYIEPYEWTHPPLGKVIMSMGIRMFGMTPFGWRFMGTLLGALMLPVMYMLAMVIFRKRQYATIAMLLMSFDFMHFVQTRIATIDTYVVFFIMCAYLFMYIYYKKNYNNTPVIKTLLPLALSGLFFGLAAASKWTGIYAGIGLGVIFFYSIYLRYREYIACKEGKIDKKNWHSVVKLYKKKTIKTIVICGLIFVLVPIIIYLMAYIPFMSIPTPGHGLEAIWDNQINMYNYHSGLEATHAYQSSWFSWPFNVTPVWLYSGASAVGENQVSSISTYGNPLIWFTGAISALFLLILGFTYKEFKRKDAMFLIIAYMAQLLPWVPVTRCTFIYHYFPSVPFSILITVYFIKRLYDKYKDGKLERRVKYGTYAYVILAMILFIMFFPTFSGMIAPKDYILFLQSIMPGWFFGAF